MRDEGRALRKAYFTVLGDGALIWESKAVPVVDEKLDVNITEQDVYVLMLDQTGTPEATANKSYFSNEIVLRIQIVNQRLTTNTKEVVENIADQILTILFPDKINTPLRPALEAPFKLTYARKISDSYNPFVQNDKGFLISKTLEFKNRITQ